jgi:hypothetical protein
MRAVQYRKHWVSLGAGLLVLAIYLPTVPRDLTWLAHSGDGGELITAAVTLGVPHPPGYPTAFICCLPCVPRWPLLC